MQSTNPNGNDQLRALTFFMTVKYNGFQDAGFQQQSATPRSNPRDGVTATLVAACGTAKTAPTIPPSNNGLSQSQNGKYASKNATNATLRNKARPPPLRSPSDTRPKS